MSNANFAIDVRIIDHRLGEVLASPDLVGCAAIDFIKGELNKAVLVSSWSDFVKNYGGVPATGSTA